MRVFGRAFFAVSPESFMITFLVCASVFLSLPAIAGFFFAIFAKRKLMRSVKASLFGYVCLWGVAWLPITSLPYIALSIGGGNPTFFELAATAFLITSPLPICIALTTVSISVLSFSINRTSNA